MVDFFKEVYNKEPRYNHKYDDLLKVFSTHGGGVTDEQRYVSGRFFSNAYEYYMYCAFLGLSIGKKVAIDKKDSHRFWNIGNWKPDEIIKFLIMSVLAKEEIDLVQLEDLEDEVVLKRINEVINALQEYANGGMEHIYQLNEDDPEYFSDDTCFVNLLKEINEPAT